MDQKTKPPYWVGVFGLFPLIGAFAGFIMIMLGAINYKSRILIWMGIASILFTVCIYGSLFYFTLHGKFGREIKSSSAIFFIDNVVMNIEMYRITHGEYPDNLSLLKTPAVDPYQYFNKNFQYHRTGDHYTVFSVGPDGIAGTRDDVYPDYHVADTTRSGLTKPAWADTIARAQN